MQHYPNTQPEPLKGAARVINTVLREAGWAVWIGAQPAQGSSQTEIPDLLATHPKEGTLLIYLARNVRSCITASGAPVRQVYASGFDDFKSLIETGRPVPVEAKTLF